MADSLQLPADALVFMASGQGSQKLGMGADLFEVPQIAEALDNASSTLGRNLQTLMVDGPESELNDTRNAQFAIAALSIGIGRALMDAGIVPDALLGFSLGQISAMALADMIAPEDVFPLLDRRSALMADAASTHPGVMSAFMKGTPEELAEVISEAANEDVLVAANFNSPGQIVVSGTEDAVARAESAWKERGYRSSRLATSGAFHSPLMRSAAEPFGAYLETLTFAEPSIPVIHNGTARPLTAAEASEALRDHLVSPVRFEESVRYLTDEGATRFAEVGFGGVLNGLVRRINKDLSHTSIHDRASFEAFIEDQS